jgi:glutamate-5-semialdehyde dehydrogenase
MSDITSLLSNARRASSSLLTLDDAKRADVLRRVADALVAATDQIIAANADDLSRMDPADPKYDRLRLTPERIAAIADDTRHVASLPSPLVELERRTLPNGLQLRKVAVAFGVVGVIYEARPNVSVDVFSLCFKSANACVLKGGHDADSSNRTLVGIIRSVLSDCGLNPDVATLLPSDREATAQLLTARGLVDLIIPRGSRRLIESVRDNARIPVIETGAGVCHCYIDAKADTAMAAAIVNNAKTRRVSVCNALDCMIINSQRLSDLPAICQALAKSRVIIHADAPAYAALEGHYPAQWLLPATDDDFGTEYLDYAMAIKTVDNVDSAIDHIAHYGSGHSEAIVTDDTDAADKFQMLVDAACVYVNSPTSFTDGAQFGLGAEIGISTQKLHARGPMALRELCTYKWLINGQGQTRP